MSDLSIISKGLLTTIQDLGRFGYRSEGIPVSGAMDQSSAKLANLLVGNQDNDALLECTMLGPKIKFSCDTYIAVTGAEVEIFVDNTLQDRYTTLSIKEGSILRFGKLYNGCRFYISFASGIDSPLTLGSSSCDTVSGIGHYPLQKGDTLNLNSTNQSRYLINITPPTNTLAKSPIKVYRGPEFQLINELDLASITFKIDPSSNRMAYVLHSDNKLHHNHEMISSGVLPGTIQLTPAGRWIALMRDAQTTGGYPRVLQIAAEDIDRLSQYRGGEEVNFQFVV